MKRRRHQLRHIKRPLLLACCLFAMQSSWHMLYGENVCVKEIEIFIGGGENQQDKHVLKGRVLDEENNPLVGATIKLKGTSLGCISNMDAEFTLSIPANIKNPELTVSFVGMETKQVKVGHRTNLTVIMVADKQYLDEVIVTGYQQLKKNAFTGNATVVSKDELLKTNNKNAISALQVFDPSFRLKEQNVWGSDPNTMPDFTIRGESSLGTSRGLDAEFSKRTQRSGMTNNPNLPIFILDGFEVSVQKIYDMDINRIESITILKDAAATAMYGSRATNGVVVVTTVAPKPGELRISYNFTAGAEFPDLSDYNLCDAEEMLRVEKLSGKYTSDDPGVQIDKDIEYNQLVNEVRRGVKTDWLAQPLRNVFNQQHSMNLSGGVESIRYNVDLNYNTHGGAMKGSYRDNYAFGLTIDYRIKKWLQVMNSISYGITKSEDSPYGTFSTYAMMKPYWTPYDNNHNLVETVGPNNIANPIYQAQRLGSYSGRSTLNDLTNNLQVNIDFNEIFSFKGSFSVQRTDSETESFRDPKEPGFRNVSSREKGSLSQLGDNMLKWNANALFYYNQSINEHFINASAGFNASQTSGSSRNTLYEGFQLSNLHSPVYAAQQKQPTSVANTKSRLFGWLGSINYSYQNIYLFDASFRMDGSSTYGENKRFAPFWSLGAGLNMHNYQWMKELGVFSLFRIHGTYGVTGNVSFPASAAVSSYKVSDYWYYSTPANSLIALGNPKLTWEKTGVTDVGIDLGLFKDRLTLQATYYHKNTRDQLSQLNIRTSSGFSTYYTNAGSVVNKGYELGLNVVPYKDKDWYVSLNLKMAANKNRITSLGQDADQYNKNIQDFHNGNSNENNSEYSDLMYIPLTQYYVGASTTAIYAVKSLGIDPSTGKELFVKRNGTVTHTWNATDEVVCGDTSPKAQGSFSLGVSWRGFFVNANFLYQWGAQAYNETLLSKVEEADIIGGNVDRRVLTERWQKPGDVKPYYDLKSTVKTQPTSRFVQDNNYLQFSGLSCGYDFKSSVVQKWHLSSLGIRFNANEICRWSTIREERGTSYPYAKNYSFTLSVGI